MKKAFAVLAVTAALAITLGGTLVVSAQGNSDYTYGRGGYAQGGCWLGDPAVDGTGVLHDVMVAEMAAALNMSVADFEAAHDSGLTFWQIALEQGFTAEEIPALMQQARDAAVAEGVAQGLITQEQADWMSQWGAGGFGGRMMGGRAFGGRGGRGGYRTFDGECPYDYDAPQGTGRWNRSTAS